MEYSQRVTAAATAAAAAATASAADATAAAAVAIPRTSAADWTLNNELQHCRLKYHQIDHHELVFEIMGTCQAV